MIINGGSRSNGAFFAKHLMRVDENERVTIREMRGFAYAENVPDAFREMQEVASGTRIKNFFYHANINTRADEQLTPEQWEQAVDALEHQLQLDGQPRFIVEHDKEGRIHRHVVWSRIDADTMTAISDSHNYRAHELTATDLEQAFGHEPTERALTRDKETTPRPDPNMKDWENWRGAGSGIDPKTMKAELTDLWRQADSGPAFAAALEERGYILARGDRRDFCVIDPAGDEHSLARRIGGVKAAEIRARMSDVDREALPSVDEGRALAVKRQVEIIDAAPAPSPAEPETGASPFDAIMAARREDAPEYENVIPTPDPQTPKPDTFDAVMTERMQAAEASEQPFEQQSESIAEGRFERVRGWWMSAREYLAERKDYFQAQWNTYFSRENVEPDDSPAPTQQQDMGPEL